MSVKQETKNEEETIIAGKRFADEQRLCVSWNCEVGDGGVVKLHLLIFRKNLTVDEE
jgi:hypothetical protein